MNKLLIGSLGIMLMASPVFAQTNTTTNTVQDRITCMGNAVATREQSLSDASNTYAQGITKAYATRANDLKAAYSQTTPKDVRSAVKKAWDDFKANLKANRKAWQSARSGAWSTFRKDASSCKASSLSDNSHALTETAGQ